MLASLTIKNVVLIDQLRIPFSNGLCAMTGETGAGKSILLDALGLALGARGDAGLVKQGCDQASVVADFDLFDKHGVYDILRENNIDTQGELIIRRTLTKEGRSKAFINDQPVSINLLKTVGESLVEVHGQFDSQNLLNPIHHILMLDEFGGLSQDVFKVQSEWQKWMSIKKELETHRQAIERAKQDEDYFRKSLEDLDQLCPTEGEEDKLSSLKDQLMRRENIIANLKEAEGGIQEIDSISSGVWRALDRLGAEGQEASQAMDRANAEIQEVLTSIQNVFEAVENNEYSLEEIDDRLYALKTQARKHDCTIDELPQKREEIAQSLNAIENQDNDFSELIKQCDRQFDAFKSQAQNLSKKRQAIAEKMTKMVMKELAPLKLEKARFQVQIDMLEQESWGKDGIDKVQFLISTNPNAPFGPLNKIASGGELSRFMLALKVTLSEVGIAESLVFDEVDSGIGGATAAAVGERLLRLSKNKQILVVTHSPQVAAMANHHWVVSKGGGKKVQTNIIPLSKNKDRQEEIARMLAGSEITNEARLAAGKLLEAGAAR